MRLIADYFGFVRMLRSVRPQVVHVNTSFGRSGLMRDAVFIMLAHRLHIPVLVFVRGWNATLEAHVGRMSVRWALAAMFRAERILVLASQFRDHLRIWGYDGRIDVETTTVDDRLIADTTSSSRAGRVGPNRTFTVLFLARIEADKGIFEAVDACIMLHRRGIPVRLVVAGDGSQLKHVIERASTSEFRSIVFLGYVRGEDKRRAFLDADVYLLPSRREGMPNSVLEAMAFGLPVVTRPVGGLCDFFVDGEMGSLIRGTAAEDFAPALTALALDREMCGRIGSHNREYARERFLASRVAARLEKIYCEVAETRSGSKFGRT